MTKTVTAIFVLVLGLPSLANAQEVEQIVLAHLGRTKQYIGTQFEYTTTREFEGKKETKKNSLALMEPDSATSTHIRRLWITYKENSAETFETDKWLLDGFCGFDGKEGRTFSRQYSADPKTVPRHQGAVTAFDPGQYNDNRFEDFLTGGPHLFPEYADRTGKGVKESPVRFKIEKEMVFLGKKCLMLKWDGGKSGKSEAVVMADPFHLTLQVKIFGQEGLLVESNVTALGEYKGVPYPREGDYMAAAVGMIKAEKWHFSVETVEPVQVKTPFFPDWPLGSVATGPGGELAVNNPYPPERLQNSLGRISPRNKILTYVNLALLAVALVGLAAFFYKRRRL